MSGDAETVRAAKKIAAKVDPLLRSGALPPMWTWWLPLAESILEEASGRVAEAEKALAAMDDEVRNALDVLTGHTIIRSHLRMIETAADVLNAALSLSPGAAAASGDRQHTPPGDFYPSDWAG